MMTQQPLNTRADTFKIVGRNDNVCWLQAIGCGVLAAVVTLGAGLASGGLFAIWAAVALAAALLVHSVSLTACRKVDLNGCTCIGQNRRCHWPTTGTPRDWLLCHTTQKLITRSRFPLQQAPQRLHSAVMVVLAVVPALLMVAGALSYNTHVLDKVGNVFTNPCPAGAGQGCRDSLCA